jgi:hypothetical protein
MPDTKKGDVDEHAYLAARASAVDHRVRLNDRVTREHERLWFTVQHQPLANSLCAGPTVTAIRHAFEDLEAVD